MNLTAERFNACYLVGTLLLTHPGFGPQDGPAVKPVVARTLGPAFVLNDTPVVMVEGYDRIALTHVNPVCGSRCPKHPRGHRCLRSPGHLSACRDQKQKGTQSCDWDPKKLRPAVRNLLRDLRFYRDPEKACWIVPSPRQWALIVPAMYGAMSFLHGYRRATVEDAVALELVQLVDEWVPVPVFDCEPKWLKGTVPHPIHGQRISLRGGAK